MSGDDPSEIDVAERAVLEAAIEWVRADMETSTYLERCRAHFNLRHTVRALRRGGGGVS